MIEVEAYLDKESNDLKAQLSKDSWKKEYYIDSKQVCDLIEYFSASNLLGFYDDGKDALFSFDSYQFKVNDYKKVFNNNELSELFLPLFFKTRKLLEARNVRNLKKKRVKRIVKYAGKGFLALGAAAYILYSTKVNAMETTLEQPKVQKPSIEYNDSQADSNYSKAIENLKEKAKEAIREKNGSNVEIDIPTMETKFATQTEDTKEKNLMNLQENKEEVVENTSDECFFVEYENRTATDKAIATKENYGAVIEKYAKIYGIDPKIMLAIATQESGDHYKYLDSGPAIGLMQIEKSIWQNGGEIKAYNFETNSWETITLTADDYDNFMYNLRDLEYNVKIACMLFQYNLKYFDYNILAGIQTYNMGIGSMDNIIDNYRFDNHLTREQVLENQYDDGWLIYRNYISSGDSLYIEHVLSYCDDDETISVKKPDGTIISITIGKNNLKKVH